MLDIDLENQLYMPMHVVKHIFLIAFVALFAAPGQAQKEIPWKENRKLTWGDFKKRVGNGGYYKAYTYSGIRYTVDEDNQQIVVSVDCYFVSDESWVYSKSQDPYLLNHEQVHFDITEIYARKMRQAFAPYEVGIDEFMSKLMIDEVRKVFNDLYDEMEERQKQYDKETNHSLIKEKQLEWNKLIEKELEELEEWK